MDETHKMQLFAQARFLRAYTYFILVRIYGGVPIPTSYTKGLEGLKIPRETVETVYSTLLMIWNIVNRIYPLKEHPITMSGGRRKVLHRHC